MPTIIILAERLSKGFLLYYFNAFLEVKHANGDFFATFITSLLVLFMRKDLRST